MCKSAMTSFWMYFNMFMCDFGHILLSKAIYLKCCSFYGAPLWFYMDHAWSAVRDLCFAWHKALRKVWNVPPHTYNKSIALLSDSVPLDISLEAHFCMFAKKTICHKNKVISYMMKIVGV